MLPRSPGQPAQITLSPKGSEKPTSMQITKTQGIQLREREQMRARDVTDAIRKCDTSSNVGVNRCPLLGFQNFTASMGNTFSLLFEVGGALPNHAWVSMIQGT